MSNTLTPTRYPKSQGRWWSGRFQAANRNRRLLSSINQRSEDLQHASDKRLANELLELRRRATVATDPTDESFLISALSIAKQALRRTLGMVAYDQQVLAGIAMAQGAIAEMATGEGKTLASAFPIVFHALSGEGVHVATVNAYLAERDFELLSPAMELLGLSVGHSKVGATAAEKRQAYQCDITFATGYELGFDFLRDQIAVNSNGPQRLGSKLLSELFDRDVNRSIATQRGHAAAIIDEIDSVLIDEATTPLVLSGGAIGATPDPSTYIAAKNVANQLVADADFTIDRKLKSLSLTNAGSSKAHQLRDAALRLTDCPGNFLLLRPWTEYVVAALRARHLMVRDVGYVVRDDRVEIVDELTGRIFSDRNWRDGLHQAVEAKEGVSITPEKRTIARISRQRYFQRYQRLCGMTGTATGNQTEMRSVYNLPVVTIPLRKPSLRNELPARYFASEDDKLSAVVHEVAQRNNAGQPILVGTRTIEQSLRIADRLVSTNVKHQVLNGVQDADEAELISIAGQRGSVIVATNMAGRGTDIKPADEALQAGGLHVIGYERNASLRIDRQLLGRAGRQGDPGSGQFFVSAEDEMIARHDQRFARALRRINNSQGVRSRDFDQRVRRLQIKSEQASYQSRCEVMKTELWMDEIRKAVG